MNVRTPLIRAALAATMIAGSYTIERVAVATDAHKLVHHGKSAKNGPVTHMHMTGQLGIVGKNRVVAHLAIVGQVHISHQPVVVTDAGHTHIAGRTDVKSAKLTDGVAVADDQFTGLPVVFFVLRNGTE